MDSKFGVCCALICVVTPLLLADSLWDPESQGLFSGSNVVQVGDAVLVSIDAETSLSYNATRVDNERITLELSGGSAGTLFDFLPAGSSSGSQSLRGGEELRLSASLAARVVAVDETGQLTIQGSRSFFIQGQEETISVSGVIDPTFIREDRTVPLSRISDARISYTTLLEADAATLRSGDLVENAVASRSTAGATPPDTAASGETGESETADQPEPIPGPIPVITAISDERQQELLLLFINRLIDLIFP